MSEGNHMGVRHGGLLASESRIRFGPAFAISLACCSPSVLEPVAAPEICDVPCAAMREMGFSRQDAEVVSLVMTGDATGPLYFDFVHELDGRPSACLEATADEYGAICPSFESRGECIDAAAPVTDRVSLRVCLAFMEE